MWSSSGGKHVVYKILTLISIRNIKKTYYEYEKLAPNYHFSPIQ